MRRVVGSVSKLLERGLPPGLILSIRYMGKPNPAVQKQVRIEIKKAKLAAKRLKECS